MLKHLHVKHKTLTHLAINKSTFLIKLVYIMTILSINVLHQYMDTRDGILASSGLNITVV